MIFYLSNFIKEYIFRGPLYTLSHLKCIWVCNMTYYTVMILSYNHTLACYGIDSVNWLFCEPLLFSYDPSFYVLGLRVLCVKQQFLCKWISFATFSINRFKQTFQNCIFWVLRRLRGGVSGVKDGQMIFGYFWWALILRCLS